MQGRNQTEALQFFFVGLTEDPAVLPLIFSFFLCIYLVTVLGNLLIIVVVSLDYHLRTPMYFFLSNLSFVDICLSSTTIPKLLVNMQTWNHTITYSGCLTQVCFILEFASLENCLLAVMSYDRYVAICHPLRYTVIMNPSLCVWLIILCLVISLENSLLLGLMLLRLSFCTNKESPLIYCELAQVIKLACSDTLINNILIYLSTFIFGGVPISGIIFSYIKIVSSVMRISSLKGRYKAFSTCVSHLVVLSLFYGTALGVYISSALTISTRSTAVASLMYTVVPQMMNPFIYSLRNSDIMEALRKFNR